MKGVLDIATFILDPETQKDVSRLATAEQKKATARGKTINRTTAEVVGLVRALLIRFKEQRECDETRHSSHD